MNERKPWLYEGLHRLNGPLLVSAIGPNGTTLVGTHHNIAIRTATGIEVAVWLTDQAAMAPKGWHIKPVERVVALTGYLLISDGTTALGQLVVPMGTYQLEIFVDDDVDAQVCSVCVLLSRD
jgi:hypothetical protein